MVGGDSGDHRVVIAGAGAAGLSAAYCLIRAGRKVLVIEGADRVGGQCASVSVGSYDVDVGPHSFQPSDSEGERLWLEAAGGDVRWVPLRARMVCDRRLYKHPPELLDVLTQTGPLELAKCVASWAATPGKLKTRTVSRDSVRSWGQRRVGGRLSERFIERYAAKVNGLPPDEIDAAWVAQWFGDVDLARIVRRLAGLERRMSTFSAGGFRYPRGGAASVYERMAATVVSLGGQIRLQSRLERVDFAPGGHRVTRIRAGGEEIDCSDLISTIPLNALSRSLPADLARELGPLFSDLRFRSALLVYYETDASRVFDAAWAYVHDLDVPAARITNYRPFRPDLFDGAGRTVICAEYWFDKNHPVFSLPESTLVERAVQDVTRAGLSDGPAPVHASRIVRLHDVLPVYRLGFEDRLVDVGRVFARVSNLHLAGRSATFKNLAQEQAMAQGAAAARRILASG